MEQASERLSLLFPSFLPQKFLSVFSCSLFAMINDSHLRKRPPAFQGPVTDLNEITVGRCKSPRFHLRELRKGDNLVSLPFLCVSEKAFSDD